MKYFIPGYGPIEKIYCFSVSDFSTYSRCPFQFFVNHHLDKKYELAVGNSNQTIGNLLDGAIKKFHKTGGPKDLEYLRALVYAQFREIKEELEANPNPSFNSAMRPFLSDEVVQAAVAIFQDYYKARNGKINPSIGEAKFSRVALKADKGCYALWGAADAYELGEDGVPEVVDYKFREDVERGKQNMDMDLMPKIYTLLAADFLKSLGYKKARFLVRIWQDPLDESLYEEFDLESLDGFKDFFKQRIDKILGTKEVKFCEKEYCVACSSKKRPEFLTDLQSKGFIVAGGNDLMNIDDLLPF